MARALVRDLIAVGCRDVQYYNKQVIGLPGGGVLTVTGQVRDNWRSIPSLRQLESTLVSGWAGQLKQVVDTPMVIIPIDSFVEVMARLEGREESR